jgi:hypothetical protein
LDVWEAHHRLSPEGVSNHFPATASKAIIALHKDQCLLSKSRGEIQKQRRWEVMGKVA